jgi:hypothetical protein
MDIIIIILYCNAFFHNETPGSITVYRAKTAKRAAAAAKIELYPRVFAPLVKTGIVVAAGVVVAGAGVVVVVLTEGVTVLTTTVVQVEVCPLVVMVVIQVVVLVMGLATQMLCLHSQA